MLPLKKQAKLTAAVKILFYNLIVLLEHLSLFAAVKKS